jgi:hypothetical protein
VRPTTMEVQLEPRNPSAHVRGGIDRLMMGISINSSMNRKPQSVFSAVLLTHTTGLSQLRLSLSTKPEYGHDTKPTRANPSSRFPDGSLMLDTARLST